MISGEATIFGRCSGWMITSSRARAQSYRPCHTVRNTVHFSREKWAKVCCTANVPLEGLFVKTKVGPVEPTRDLSPNNWSKRKHTAEQVINIKGGTMIGGKSG